MVIYHLIIVIYNGDIDANIINTDNNNDYGNLTFIISNITNNINNINNTINNIKSIIHANNINKLILSSLSMIIMQPVFY